MKPQGKPRRAALSFQVRPLQVFALLLSEPASFETLRTATHPTGRQSEIPASLLDKDDSMTRRIAPLFTLPVVAPLGFCLLLGAGCVSRHTYDTIRTEADELTRAVETARSENEDLEQQVAMLQLRNKQEDAALLEVRAAIRQELEAAPLLRQRADDKLGALQTQVAYLVNQNRLLGREMAEAKQERVSLQALAAQHKQEVDEASRSVLTPSAFPSSPQYGAPHRLAPAVPTPVQTPVPTPVPPAVATASAPSPPSIPAKTATVPRPAKAAPDQPDESWAGKIKSWASSLWGWIFG